MGVVGVCSVNSACYSGQESSASSGLHSVITNVAKAALGVAVGFAIQPFVSLLGDKIFQVMTGFKLDMSADQDIISIWKDLDQFPLSILRVTLKTALAGYIVFLGPLLEELMFRLGLQELFKSLVENPDSILNGIARTFGNGFVFGLAHLSPMQGWVNVPIFCITFALGCVFTLLTELTGDIVSSSAAHMTYNGIVMSHFLTSSV